jgi:predicted aspartyl protease
MRSSIGIFAAVATLATPAAQAASSCRLQSLGELPLTLRDGHLFVDVRIDGRPARMVLASGAFTTELSHPGAAALDLNARPISAVELAQAYGAGAEPDAAVARVATFQLGALVARNLYLPVVGNPPPGDAQGILGPDFLAQADVEFDVPAGRLRFFKSKGCKGDDVVYWGQAYSSAPMTGSDAGRHIRVTVQANGVPIVAELDTGSGHSVMTERAAEWAEVTPQEGVVSVADPGGAGPTSVPTYVGVLKTLAFGDEIIRNAKLEIADRFDMSGTAETGIRPLEPEVDPPGIRLGADFFRAHRVYVAPGQRTVYISYEGGRVFKTRVAATLSAPRPAP